MARESVKSTQTSIVKLLPRSVVDKPTKMPAYHNVESPKFLDGFINCGLHVCLLANICFEWESLDVGVSPVDQIGCFFYRFKVGIHK
jgi:hypothetical protein